MKGKQFINFLAYIAVAIIAVVLVLGKLLGWLINPNILNILNLVAQLIAYIITAVYAFAFAKTKRNVAWMIVFVVAIILILVFSVLNFTAIINALKG